MRTFLGVAGFVLLLTRLLVGHTGSFRELTALREVRTEHDAIQIAKRAISAVSFDAGPESAMKVIKGKLAALDEWTVLTSGGKIMVMIEAKTSKIIGIANMERRYQQYRGIGRTGRLFITSESKARVYLRGLADKLGVPSDASMQKVGWCKDGSVQDGNSTGYLGCVFKDDAGHVIATLSCDVQDGLMTMFSRTVAQP